MATITLKDIPEDLHASLKREAAANFRSLNQEAMVRLLRTLDLDEAKFRKRDQEWVDEALASGPATPLTRSEMDKVRDRVLKKK